MEEEQRKAIDDLIRTVRAATYTLRGLWYYTRTGSTAEMALREIETRLDSTANTAQAALDKSAEAVAGEMMH